jgi:hypothetical protein
VTDVPIRVTARPRLATLAVYGTGIGLSAFLLFAVEPLVGRLALPVFGGAPSAWATVLAFFQGVLLLGYLYGHLSVTRLGLRRGALAHVAVAVLAFGLLLGAPADWATLRNEAIPPGLNLLVILAITVGPAAFLLTATTPLLSAWYAGVRDAETPGAVDPYWLYALSNGASLAALLAYPFLFEPALGLAAQRLIWTSCIGVFVLLVAAGAWRVRRTVHSGPGAAGVDAVDRDAADDHSDGAVTGRRRLRWFVLAAIPSGLLTAVTTFIATDLVSAPLLWVGPLALYLGSFVVAFSGRGNTLVRWATVAAPAAATLLWVPLGSGGIWPLVPLVAIELAGFGIVATALHGRLAADRPGPRHLTDFYLVLAAAGVVAGGGVALVAPAVFPDVWEYPLLVGSAAATLALTGPASIRAAGAAAARRGFDLGPFFAGLAGRLGPYALVAALLAVALIPRGGLALEAGLRWLLVGAIVLLVGGVARFFALATAVVLALAVFVLPPTPLFRERSFFGVTVVLKSPDGALLALLNGTTLHGVQYLDPARRRLPTTYYVEEGPIGDVFRRLREMPAPAGGRTVGVVGLGAGSMAAYARSGEHWTFFEIDPVVVRVAQDPAFFTFLSDAEARPTVVMGDGRLELERVADGAHDLLVLDAFSSDAIPAHLLTVEALGDAMRTVAPGGLLAVHISNRYYDLAPAVAAAARDLGLVALRRVYAPTPAGEDVGASGSAWVVLARDPALVAPLSAAGWKPVPGDGVAPITDDRPDILRFLYAAEGAAEPGG